MRAREEIRAALTDEAALVCTLLGEAANEPIEGQVAVGCTIRNRVRKDLGQDSKPDWWGEGYVGVCLKRLQFSCWWEHNGNTDRVYRVADAMIDWAAARAAGDSTAVLYSLGAIEPALVPTLDQLTWVAAGIVSGALLDRSKGADHYLTTALLHSAAAPAWAKTKPAVAVVGAHTFFRLS